MFQVKCHYIGTFIFIKSKANTCIKRSEGSCYKDRKITLDTLPPGKKGMFHENMGVKSIL